MVLLRLHWNATPGCIARLLNLELRDVRLVTVDNWWHPLLMVLFVRIALLKNVAYVILTILRGVEGAHASVISPRQLALLRSH